MAQSLAESLEKTEAVGGEGGETFFGEAGEDPLFEEVKKIVIETKKASASFLQRRLRIGYSRAARLIDMLEERGIVGPADGAKPREVYGDTGKSSGLTSSPDTFENGDESETAVNQSRDASEEVAEKDDDFKPI